MNNATTSKAKAITNAKAQVAKGKLAWVAGDGYPISYTEVRKASGLKYGPAWRAITAALMPASAKVKPNADEAKLAAQVAQLRDKNGYSWGYIAIALGIGEGRTRSLYTKATGVLSQGLRNGNGGRFYQRNAKLYTGGTKKATGTQIRVAKATARKAKATKK